MKALTAAVALALALCLTIAGIRSQMIRERRACRGYYQTQMTPCHRAVVRGLATLVARSMTHPVTKSEAARLQQRYAAVRPLDRDSLSIFLTADLLEFENGVKYLQINPVQYDEILSAVDDLRDSIGAELFHLLNMETACR